MGLTLITPASVFPVTLEEAKAFCSVIHDDHSAMIASLIKGATGHIEESLGISIAAQTWKLTLDAFTDAIELPRGPVISVAGVQYFDEAGASQTAGAGLYTADLTSDRQWVVLNSDESWPDTLDAVNAVSVTYTAGMATVPENLKMAVLFHVREAYDNRGAGAISDFADDLLQSYRRVFV